MSKKCTFYQITLCLIFIFGVLCLNAQTIWIGNSDSDWANASNWTAGVPGAGIDATIPNVSGDDPVIMTGTNAFAKSVWVQGGGKLTTETGSTLTIDGSSHHAITNDGTFENSGTISIGANSFIKVDGISNRSVFHNKTGGEITIDDIGFDGIVNLVAASDFTNDGKISIGGLKRIVSDGIHNFLGIFKNNAGSELNIDDCGNDGIRKKAVFINGGIMNIGANKSIKSIGIFNSRGSFTNEPGSELNIDNCETGFFISSGVSSVTNAGKMTIGAINPPLNDDIKNFKNNFENQSCGEIHLYGKLFNFRTITNAGLFSYKSLIPPDIGTFINNGIVEDPHNIFNGFSNNEIEVTPTVSGNALTVSPALNLGNPIDFNISVFFDAATNNSAGNFDEVTNTFTANSMLPEGVNNLFLKIEDPVGGCTRVIPWELTAPLSFSIGDVSQLEGNWFGFTYYVIPITRNGPNVTSVQYATANGTATVMSDYLPASGTLYWAYGGSNTRYVLVLVKKDNIYESDETFYVNLSNPTGGATLTNGQGEGTILNDDAAPVIGNTEPPGNVSYQNESFETIIYPNPTRDMLKIKLPNEFDRIEVLKGALFDNTGIEIQTFEIRNSETEINVRDLPEGMYQLVLFSEKDWKTTRKFLKIN